MATTMVSVKAGLKRACSPRLATSEPVRQGSHIYISSCYSVSFKTGQSADSQSEPEDEKEEDDDAESDPSSEAVSSASEDEGQDQQVKPKPSPKDQKQKGKSIKGVDQKSAKSPAAKKLIDDELEELADTADDQGSQSKVGGTSISLLPPGLTLCLQRSCATLSEPSEPPSATPILHLRLLLFVLH